ncbi:MAG: hypothetical protein JSV56_04175 [Methanomassiliicoccales archaeon]|nr:MAG: hypothetical protein JSV56_04175 [Methanomassiliicoccales archaeon]
MKEDGRTVLRPNARTPILEDEIKLCKTIYESGMPLIPITAGTYTRQLQFEKARAGLEGSERTGRPMLNGYPRVKKR